MRACVLVCLCACALFMSLHSLVHMFFILLSFILMLLSFVSFFFFFFIWFGLVLVSFGWFLDQRVLSTASHFVRFALTHTTSRLHDIIVGHRFRLTVTSHYITLHAEAERLASSVPYGAGRASGTASVNIALLQCMAWEISTCIKNSIIFSQYRVQILLIFACCVLT